MANSGDRITQDEVVQSLRSLLINEASVREVSMFGGRAFMVNNKMVVSALKDGGLLVRVAEGDHDELCRRPGASQAYMGAERSMGPGWIEVSPEQVADEAELKFWFDVSIAYNLAKAEGFRQ